MLPVLINLLRPYATYITFPVALVIGFAGYHIEGWISDKYTPYSKSVQVQRLERQLEEQVEAQKYGTLKDKNFIPATIFERNLSPSLVETKETKK